MAYSSLLKHLQETCCEECERELGSYCPFKSAVESEGGQCKLDKEWV